MAPPAGPKGKKFKARVGGAGGGDLLAAIRSGGKLKKAETVDKSAPMIPGAAELSGEAAPAPPPAGSMMAQMLAKRQQLGTKKRKGTGKGKGTGSAASVDGNDNIDSTSQPAPETQQQLTPEQQLQAKAEAKEKADAKEKAEAEAKEAKAKAVADAKAEKAAANKVKFADLRSDRDGLKKRVEAINQKLGKAERTALLLIVAEVKRNPTGQRDKAFDLAYMRFMFKALKALNVEGTADWKEPSDAMKPATIETYMAKIKTTSEEFMATTTDAHGGASDDDYEEDEDMEYSQSDDDDDDDVEGGSDTDEHDDEEDDDDVEGGSEDEEQEGEEEGGGKPLVLYEPSVRRVLMSMLLEDERASAATCADRFCRRDFSRCRLPCCPADRRLLDRCAEAELRELVYALHPLLRRAW
jgi:hypothetical protein